MKLKLLTLCGAGALAGVLAVAHPAIARGGDGPNGAMKLERLTRQLDLSEEQRTQIEGIMEERKVESEAHRDALSDAREELAALVSAETLDEDKAREIAAAKSEAQAELTVLRARTVFEIAAVLEPEQREKFLEMKRRGFERKGRHKRRHRAE